MREPNTLGKFLRKKRHELGLTIAELSKKMSLSPSTISYVEIGQFSSPTVYTITKFSDFYGITIVELMKMIDEPDFATKEYLINHD